MKVSVVVCLLFTLFAITLAASSDEDDRIFEEWREKFNKQYCSKESEEKAKKNVLERHREIEEHNKAYDEGKESFTMGLTWHSDLTDEEMNKYRYGFEENEEDDNEQERSTRQTERQFPKGPKSIDWRKKQLIGPPPNQGHCGSCWAFSAAAVVDVAQRKKGIKGFASEQQLVDCFTRDDGKLCRGSKPDWAMVYIKEHGMTDRETYPYVASQGKCKYNETMDKKFTIKSWNRINLHGNETEMANIVASVGPIGIAVYVSHKFKHYQGGVFVDKTCGDTHPNHAPVIVGYGTDPKHGEYWIIRNSWGTGWGENGYMRIARNYGGENGNMCRVAHFALYAE